MPLICMFLSGYNGPFFYGLSLLILENRLKKRNQAGRSIFTSLISLINLSSTSFGDSLLTDKLYMLKEMMNFLNQAKVSVILNESRYIIPILKSENSQYTDEDVAQNHGDLQQSRCFVA